MSLTYIKVACGLLLLASLFALVILGRWDADQYATLVVSILTGIGAHAATAWQPKPSPVAAEPVSETNPTNQTTSQGTPQ